MESVIFGAGRDGRVLKKGLEKYYGVHIGTICDNDMMKWGCMIDGVEIIPPQKLTQNEFEKVFICVSERRFYDEIKIQLLDMGIPEEKIVIMKRSSTYSDAYIEFDPVRKNWIKAFSDYSREIGLQGSTAECGVYRGDTSIFINKYWPDRSLYLFDTFEGFLEKDLTHDSNAFYEFRNGQFAKNPFKIDTSDSLIDIVKTRMSYPDNIKIFKGYFPESADGIKDRFCFVNLDMDLYQPQLEGLRFFWGKMEEGAVILLHDYFHPELPGVKEAVVDFEKELGQRLPKLPIGDNCSIAIIKNE